jgi:hypothetical protein
MQSKGINRPSDRTSDPPNYYFGREGMVQNFNLLTEGMGTATEIRNTAVSAQASL